MTKQVSFKHISMYQSPNNSPGYLLWRVSMQWRNTIEKLLKQYNLTHPQFVVLATIAWLTKDGKKVNQVEVGRMAGLDPNTTSQIVRGLEDKKYIKRKQTVDERSKNPIVTPLGATLLSKALPVVEKGDSYFFEKLNNNEIDSMIKLFQKLML